MIPRDTTWLTIHALFASTSLANRTVHPPVLVALQLLLSLPAAAAGEGDLRRVDPLGEGDLWGPLGDELPAGLVAQVLLAAALLCQGAAGLGALAVLEGLASVALAAGDRSLVLADLPCRLI